MPEQPLHLANKYEDIVNLQGAGGILWWFAAQLVNRATVCNLLLRYFTNSVCLVSQSIPASGSTGSLAGLPKQNLCELVKQDFAGWMSLLSSTQSTQ